ncbi:hypothetical protein [Thalassoroseus pseudoceratinae]|uniref:hypothetical protein n=1 Tax=Thalassoroseus pseudoceratinae TaxID=2713176 RepID=UPI0014231EAD|nr:hypothetical protein [Thalassoroseus pseudoceratinae]
MRSLFASRSRVLAPLAVPLLFLVGCGDGVEYAPVKGSVTNGTEKLTTGTVRFVPDKDQGNESTLIPESPIADDGTYALFTKGVEGAPVGAYKVVVTAQEANNAESDSADAYAVPVYLVKEEYTNKESTPLQVEVKSDGGSGDYDLTLEAD